MRNKTNNTMYIVEELHTFGFEVSLKIISFPSMFSQHSSINLSTILQIYPIHIHNY